MSRNESFPELVDEPQEHKGSTMSRHSKRSDESYTELVENPEEFTGWAVVEGQLFFPSEKTIRKIPAGAYRIKDSDRGIHLAEMELHVDDLIRFSDSVGADLLSQIQLFWDSEKMFQQMGYLWKRGILIWGPPGSGKTSLVQMLIEDIIERDGIVLISSSPNMLAAMLQRIRRIERHRSILVILEDLDAIISDYGEANLLSLLDGETQIDNVLYLATTNYPEKLDGRIVNRPSRFDIVQYVGMPSPQHRRIYLETRDPELADNPKELKKWVDATENFSLAHLKELLLSVRLFKASFADAVTRLRSMMEGKKLTSDEYQKLKKSGHVGFTPPKSDKIAVLVGEGEDEDDPIDFEEEREILP